MPIAAYSSQVQATSQSTWYCRSLQMQHSAEIHRVHVTQRTDRPQWQRQRLSDPWASLSASCTHADKRGVMMHLKTDRAAKPRRGGKISPDDNRLTRRQAPHSMVWKQV